MENWNAGGAVKKKPAPKVAPGGMEQKAALAKMKPHRKGHRQVDIGLMRAAFERNRRNAPQIARNYSDKPWAAFGVKETLRKIEEGAPTTRQQGSGWPISTRTSANIRKVADKLKKGCRKRAVASRRETFTEVPRSALSERADVSNPSPRSAPLV